MKNLVKKAAVKKVKREYSVGQLIEWYISDLDEYYPTVTDDMKKYRADIAKHGEAASAQLSLAIMKHCAYKTENAKLKDMLTNRYIGAAAATIVKNKHAKSIWDLVQFLIDLKEYDEKYANINIDLKKYSQAMAATGNLEYNRYWVESFDEYAANYELLMNSNDAKSALFLAKFLQLSKEDFKRCENVVLAAKNAKLSGEFADLEGANSTKHRKIVIDSKDAMENCHYLLNRRCTVKQVTEHKAAIYNSTDPNKLKASVLALTQKPEFFSQNESADIIKTVIKTRNTQLAKILLISDELSVNDKAKLESMILKSKDLSSIRTLKNVRFDDNTRKQASEREKELATTL